MAKGENYEQFVEKFKPKKTTDDCYTPENIYNVVREWAVKEYRLQGREIARPFYPGGDFENYNYPDNCVVIDNPPFSILAKIKAFYIEHGIDFFLFAPTLTLFSSNSSENYIVIHETIAYANGARVATSFVTNLGEYKIRTAPELQKLLKEANKENVRKNAKKVPKYSYPDNVTSAALMQKIANTDFRIKENECYFIRSLESQRKSKKSIFGGGFIISDKKAAELRVAELETMWELSEAEKDIIKKLR